MFGLERRDVSLVLSLSVSGLGVVARLNVSQVLMILGD